jgi:hypothetical protein
MLTQEEGEANGEVNKLSVHRDLDQSPEEPKVVANIEEGKHRSAYNLFGKNLISFTFQYLCFVLCI